MKRTMTTIMTAILVGATPVLASGGEETMGTGLLVFLFLGFGALIVVCQLIPSLLLFFSMIKGLFDHTAGRSIPKAGAKLL
jgi:hypothetical protein